MFTGHHMTTLFAPDTKTMESFQEYLKNCLTDYENHRND